MLRTLDILRTKRDGRAVSADDLRQFVLAYTRGEVPDYQMSAFLMAAFINGLTGDETDTLVDAMLRSGSVLDLSDISGKKVDKHSTGGVGDKVSLILAPLVAALGVRVPMISGRGLGHSGGTLDKLESIPGLRTDLSVKEMKDQLAAVGLAMIGQTAEIAPADKKLYALRDVTATVEFIPFIAASIMSKKLAEGLDGLVLDVKVGNGAFMRTEDDARALAEALADVGNRHGCETVALMTDMNRPLGLAVGNWLEVAESLDVLQGGGPEDTITVTCALAAEMLVMGGSAESPEAGVEMARQALQDGSAMDRFRQMVTAQGGEAESLRGPWSRPELEEQATIEAEEDGYLGAIDTYAMGMASVRMGAGRERKEDSVDPFAGLTLNKNVGDPVRAGETLVTLYGSDRGKVRGQVQAVEAAITVQSERPEVPKLIRGRYAAGNWTDI